MNTEYPALLGYDDDDKEHPHPIVLRLKKGARLVALEVKLEFRSCEDKCFNLQGQLDDGSVHLFSAWCVHPRLFYQAEISQEKRDQLVKEILLPEGETTAQAKRRARKAKSA